MLKKLINDLKDGLDILEALYNYYNEVEKQEILKELFINSNFKELINNVNEKYEILDLIDFFQELEKYSNNIDRELCLIENNIDPLQDQSLDNDIKYKENEEDDNSDDEDDEDEEDDNSGDENNEEDKGENNLPKKLINNIEHNVAITNLNAFFKNKLVTKIDEYIKYANKNAGHTTGAIATKKDDGTLSLFKHTTKNEVIGQRASERREWIQEYITAPLYKRLLPGEVTPNIELVITQKENIILLRSIFLKNFHTLKEAENKAIINKYNANTIINFEKLFAVLLFLGEADYHKGNLGIITNDNKIYAAKVDHGRSDYNFYENVNELIHKLHNGFFRWIGYDKLGFQLNIEKLKQAVNEIIKISPAEIETLLNSRFEKLRKYGVEYKDSYRDLTYSSKTQERYPTPEKLSFTGTTSLDHPNALRYKAHYFIEELRKITLILDPKGKKDLLRERMSELQSEIKTLKEAEALSLASKKDLINIDPSIKTLNIEQLEEKISALQINHSSALESLNQRLDIINDQYKLIKSKIKVKTREYNLYKHLYMSIDTNNYLEDPIKDYLAKKEATYLRILQYREAEKWYLDKYTKQLEIFKQFGEYLDFISKIDELDEGFKNGEWLFRIPHGETPQEWVKKNNYLINEKIFMSPMIFLLWKSSALKGKGLGELIKNPKYKNFIDQIIFKLALHDLENKTKAVENLIAAGVDINHSDSNSDNALMMAARDGEVEVISYLIALGADIERANSKGETPLLIAIKKNKVKVINFLLARNANLETTDIKGNNALLSAIISGNLDVINTIISLNPKKNVLNKNFESPVHLAIKLGYLDVFKLLAKDHLFYLEIAIKNNHVDIVQYILELNSDKFIIQHIKDKALLFCIKNNANIIMINMLLANGANPYVKIPIPSARGATSYVKESLTLAVEFGYAEIVSSIINSINMNINLETKNSHENNAFMLSVERSNHKLIKTFYNYGFKHDIDKIKQALKLSLSKSDFGVVTLLLSNYAEFSVMHSLNHVTIKPNLGFKEYIEKLFSIASPLPNNGVVEYSWNLGEKSIQMQIICKNLPQLIKENLAENTKKIEETVLPNTKPEINKDLNIELSTFISLPESMGNLMLGSEFTQQQGADPLLITFPVESPKGNSEKTSERASSQTKFQFIKGTLCGKLLLSPALNYLKDNIKDEQNDKNLFDYFLKSIPESFSYIAKSLIFAGVSFVDILHNKPYGLANKMMLYKFSSDLIYNVVSFQSDKTFEMFSKEYGKEMTFFLIPSTLSMIGFNTDTIFNQENFLTGIIFGSLAEIVGLAEVGIKEFNNAFYSEEGLN